MWRKNTASHQAYTQPCNTNNSAVQLQKIQRLRRVVNALQKEADSTLPKTLTVKPFSNDIHKFIVSPADYEMSILKMYF